MLYTDESTTVVCLSKSAMTSEIAGRGYSGLNLKLPV